MSLAASSEYITEADYTPQNLPPNPYARMFQTDVAGGGAAGDGTPVKMKMGEEE
jgi:hypothetical protein